MAESFGINGIHYTISGSGPVILMLHGFMETGAIWNRFAGLLKNDFTTICVDLPGHGSSKLPEGNMSVQLMAQAVSEVILNEKIENFVVCGHSMGGYVALQLAEDFPGKVKGLVLFHSHAAPDSEEARENRRRTINIVNQNKSGYIRQFIPLLFDQKHVQKYSAEIETLRQSADLLTDAAIVASLSAMRDRSSKIDLLTTASFPFLFIIGKQDSRMAYNQVLAQAVMPTHSEVLLLEDVGHMGFLEAPEITCNALKHFALRCFEPGL